jgi:hypothetical protein
MAAGLDPKLATIAKNLPKVCKSLGFNARVTSGYRSKKKQTELYINYKNGYSPYPAAYPGTSDHEIGMAIDVVTDNQDALVALLTAAGLYWAGPSDPIHFSAISPKSKIIKARGESKQYKVPTAEEWQAITRTGKYDIESEVNFFLPILKWLGIS